ncbi:MULTISPECIES: hypothetical protein [unclassified Streptomyces]|uniref:hypothetical protein n=1 Tax=unclassified Streptomyces TaxID=2593676 RepID=UPI001E2CB4BB|nr:hypothetical protein [Streptomyces sp. MBT42]MCD2466865.1 hypothetical protein [Streptomyces sp. MBT42]
MARTNLRRLVTGLVLTGAAIAAPLATAAPASATQSSCIIHMSDLGYVIGPKVRSACGWPADHFPIWKPSPACMGILSDIGVSNWQHRYSACMRA